MSLRSPSIVIFHEILMFNQCNEIEELTTGRWCLIGYIRVRIIAREMR